MAGATISLPDPTLTSALVMLWNSLLLAGGCILLYAGATWLVRGASEIAVALKIPKAIVGLSLVAFGTSAPELIVNLIAAYQGQTGFALSNVSGSNLTNLCVGFGLCGVISGLLIHWRTFFYDLWALVLSALAPLVIMLIMLLDDGSPRLPSWSILPLGAGLAAYLFTLLRRFKDLKPNDEPAEAARSLVLSGGLFLLGALTLYFGGHLVLEGAVAFAAQFNIDTSLVGLTIVAAGTSIPDAIASIVAARRGEHDIAVGNLLGSNIANILLVITGTLLASLAAGGQITDPAQPIVPGALIADQKIVLDYAMIVVASVIFCAIAIRWGRITRTGGLLMIASYLGYMGLRIYLEYQ